MRNRHGIPIQVRCCHHKIQESTHTRELSADADIDRAKHRSKFKAAMPSLKYHAINTWTEA